MIAGILRTVLLRFASEYLSNVDINKLSLWSGKITLQNVQLNIKALTESLNLNYLAITEGIISKIELVIPWSSLSVTPVHLKLSQVTLELSFEKNQTTPSPPKVSESEESLLKKVLDNLNLEVEDLKLKLKAKEENFYFGEINIKQVKMNACDEFGKLKFLNGFASTPGGVKYKLIRRLEVRELSGRVISGTQDNVSMVVISHKIDSPACGGCPVCYAFKSSSCHSLCSIESTSFVVMLTTGFENSVTNSKSQFVELIKDTSELSIQIHYLTPLQVKLNLVSDSAVCRDLSKILSSFSQKLSENFIEEENSSWFSWGRDLLLSPFCSNSRNKIQDKLFSRSFSLQLEAPSVQLAAKLHNPQSLQQSKLSVYSGEFSCRSSNFHSSSSKGSSPNKDEKVITGSASNFLASFYVNRDYVLYKSVKTTFESREDWLNFRCKDLTAQVFQGVRGNLREACRTSQLSGRIEFLEELNMKLSTDPLALGFTIEEMMIVITTLLEAKAFYYRVQNCFERTNPVSMQEILHSHQASLELPYSNKLGVYQDTVDSLKTYAGSLADKLQSAEQEVKMLRKVLGEVAGPAGFARLLSVDPSSVLAFSNDASIEGFSVKMVLTSDSLYVMAHDGKVLHKNYTSDMVKLEEKGDLLTIKMKKRAITAKLTNREEFASAIKNLFISKK